MIPPLRAAISLAIALGAGCCGTSTDPGHDQDTGAFECGNGSASCTDPVSDPAEDDCEGVACAPVCPPPEPYGYEIGSRLHNLTFTDCDGGLVQLHDLCGADAGLIFNFYGWCTGCYRFLEEAADIHSDYHEQGLVFIVVVSEDPIEQPATQEYCTHIRDRYDLSMTVVFDPEGELEAYGESDLAIVTDEGARIVFKRCDASVNAIRTAVEAELDRP